jgi:integrase
MSFIYLTTIARAEKIKYDRRPNREVLKGCVLLKTQQRQLSSDSTSTFKAFAQEWLDENDSGRRHSHKNRVLRILKGGLIDWSGEREVSRTTKADSLKFCASLAKVERKESGKSFFAENFNEIHMKNLRLPIREAVDCFNFTSPFRGVKMLKTPEIHIASLTIVDVNSILAAAYDDVKAYYAFRFFTDVRNAEIGGLALKTNDFNQRQIVIRETGVIVLIKYTNTENSRSESAISLPAYYRLRQQWQGKGGKYAYAFANSLGNPLLRFFNLISCIGYKSHHTSATLGLTATSEKSK